MTKTMAIDDDIHKLIVDKQKEIKEKSGMNLQLKDIVGKIIRENINKFDSKELKN